jgi:autotransporter-associated beta strand protein
VLSAGEQAASVTFNDSYTLGSPSGGLTLFGSGVFSVASGKTVSMTPFLTGTVGLNKSGAGTLNLTGVNNNTFTGGVQIAGTLGISEDAKLGNAANTVLLTPGVTVGTLHIMSASFSTSRVISVGGFGGVISVDATRTYTVNAGLAGSGPLTVDGAGTLSLNAVSSRSNNTTIRNGTVHLGNAAGLGTAGRSFRTTACWRSARR